MRTLMTRNLLTQRRRSRADIGEDRPGCVGQERKDQMPARRQGEDPPHGQSICHPVMIVWCRLLTRSPFWRMNDSSNNL